MRDSYDSESWEMLTDLRSRVAKVTHDLNNPLTVIAGNAQLLAELITALNLPEDLRKPVRDIEEASLELANSLHALNALSEPDVTLESNGQIAQAV
ncbi:hypothetical protein BH23ACT11_BH23ACT11_16890 [soil metagenome]